jgi:lysophospholipase L1-like esterase
VTIDLGFNDVAWCLRNETVDLDCVTGALERIQLQLPEILNDIQDAAPPGTEIVGLNHYDPYIADERDPQDRAFALRSIDVVGRLDDLLDQIYRQHRIGVADVLSAFSNFAVSPSTDGPVAQACALTWMCVDPPLGPNPHPNDVGYRVIASAIADVISGDQ